MTVTVLAILDTEFRQEPALAKIMNNRLQRVAKELKEIHLSALLDKRTVPENLIVHISYTTRYKIRYRIVNKVPNIIAYFVAEQCSRLGYILWKEVLSEQGSYYRL
ncbi:hypothetical protein G7074_11445 [Pedobacter sp. HDW13]|uniref:hypothetical protein n=1 Tax=unclassified Pedobacter TaxID=2628915 RepID=UPI000F59AA3F|nr:MULTISPECIES: hypothetical protein [unclassified Pedobacter]QIL39825.1 hypothetical protein G7074_11445 [Pedobacter sp. HDW13]RQO79690.1 hypothetical protein DBR40_01660 [Pedobacter sp. KBW01]